MRKFDVQIALEGVREAREKWVAASMKFKSNIDFVMSRLLHEAAVNRMSVGEVSMMSGLTVKQVREMMRRAGLDPKTSKTLLAKQAAEALAENSALMGIEPHEMDLTSPLAYLPMGSELKQQLIDARVSRVTELPDEFPETDGRLFGVLNHFAEHPEDLSEIPRMGAAGVLGWLATEHGL